MSDLYWVTAIGGLHTVFFASLIVYGILVFVFGSAFFLALTDVFDYYDEAEAKLKRRYFSRLGKWLVGIGMFLLFGTAFTPSKTDMYVIFGVGGVIDYVKENETAQGIPDKCVKALDKWVESLSDDDEKKGGEQ